MLKPSWKPRGAGAWSLVATLALSACAAPPQVAHRATPNSDPSWVAETPRPLPDADAAVAWALRLQSTADSEGPVPWWRPDPERVQAARQAWVRAVAAREAVSIWQTHLEASQVSLELARRSQAAGHLSAFELARVQAQTLDVREQHLKASLQATQAELNLGLVLGGPTAGSPWLLPDRLPPLPDEADLARWWQRVGPGAPARVRSAAAELQTASALARLAADERLPLARQRLDEAVLRYNGMLISVFDLLAIRQELAQAEWQALEARRDLALAQDELMALLAGGRP